MAPIPDIVRKLEGRPAFRFRSKLILALSLLISLSLGSKVLLDIIGIPGTGFPGKTEQARKRTLGDLELVSGFIGQNFAFWYMDLRSDLRDLAENEQLRADVRSIGARTAASESSTAARIGRVCSSFLASHPDFTAVSIVNAGTGQTIFSQGEKRPVLELAGAGVGERLTYPETVRLYRDPDGAVHIRIIWKLAESNARDLSLLVAESNIGQAFIKLVWRLGAGFAPDWRCQLSCMIDGQTYGLIQGRASDPTQDRFQPLADSGNLITSALQGIEGPFDGSDGAGTAILAYVRSISFDEKTNLALSLSMDTSTALSVAIGEIWRQLAVWGLLLAGVIALGALIAARVTRPVSALIATARRIEAGDLTARVETVSSRELAELPVVFNSMIDRLQTWNQDMESRIARRTEEFRALNQRLEAVLFAVPDIMMEIDSDLKYVWANQAGQAFFGAGVVGCEAWDYFRDANQAAEAFAPLFLDSGGLIRFESWQYRHDGEWRLLAWWCQSIMDDQARVIGAICTARDMTDRRNDEVRMAQALQEKEVLIREVYHRTKNTMQVIQGLLTLQAGEHPESPEFGDLVKVAEQRIQTIALVHRMLYASQDLSHVTVSRYMEELTELILELNHGRERGIAIDCRCVDLCLPIDVIVPLGLIVNELLTNSLKHAWPSGQPGSISLVIAEPEAGVVEMRYADNGDGLPAVIGPNQSAPGLGMKLVRNLGEEQLGGTVEVSGRGGDVEWGYACKLRFPLPPDGSR